MKTPATFLMVPFREVRHNQPDDCLHYEPIDVRGRLHEWTIPPHRHENLHQFHLLCRGTVTGTIDGVRQVLQAPVAWMVAPGVVHGFAYEPDSMGHQVTMPSQGLKSALTNSPALLQQLRRCIVAPCEELLAEGAACEELFARIGTEFAAQSTGRSEALQAHAMLLALWFLRREPQMRDTERRPAPRDTLVQRYRSLMEQHFCAEKTVHFYATLLGVSPDHLSRVCRGVSGSGALALLHERVVLEARRMLAYTPVPVSCVARELGFDDPGHFSRFFSKLAGHSPSEYRQAVSEGLGTAPAH